MRRLERGTHLPLALVAGILLIGGGALLGRHLPGMRSAPAPSVRAVQVSIPPSANEDASPVNRGGKSTEEEPPVSSKSIDSIRLTPVVKVARRVSPAVVSVGAERTVMAELDPFFRGFFTPYYYVPQRQRIPYMGSGFVINPKGYIVTNQHVVDGATRIFVTLTDGRELEATLLDADRYSDVALLKVEAEDLPFVELGDSDDLMIGETAVAIGNPFGNYIQDPHPTVTAGVISALQRSFRPDSQSQRVYENMIQTDAAINPGNSGGPLVTLDSKVVGMNTFIVSPGGGGSVGLGFAIPSNRIQAIVDEIMKHGHLRPLLIDFNAVTLNPRLARRLDVNAASGVVVVMTNKNGPSEKAGLKVGDTIVKVDGRAVATVDDLFLFIAAKQVGDTVEMTLLRAGQTLQISYRIEEATPGDSSAPPRTY